MTMTSRSENAECQDCGELFHSEEEWDARCHDCSEAAYDEANQHSPQVTFTDRDYQRDPRGK